MADNAIAVLPESLANLTKLRVCDFSDNRLAVLPEAFGGVRIVNQLRVRNNPLTTLPAGFAAMRATIDITGTRIDPASLPPELRRKISTEKPPGSKNEDPVVRVRERANEPTSIIAPKNHHGVFRQPGERDVPGEVGGDANQGSQIASNPTTRHKAKVVVTLG